jgi:Fe-S oxidoreductase
MEQIEVNGNPLGFGFASRGDWAQDLGIARADTAPGIDILYFVGCYASFDRRNVNVARSFVALCRAAGVRVGILGDRERCCGEPIRKLGNEYLYQTLARDNIAAIVQGFPRKVVTACPHCFNTLANDYRDFGFDTPVEHAVTFLEGLLASGRLPLTPRTFDFTYHDSCYLGRYNALYRAPRRLLGAAGGTLRELRNSGAHSFCCGGGGGRILAEERTGERISASRVRMAAATGVPILVANCPFCLTQLEDGVKGEGSAAHLQVRDLVEVLAERLAPGASTLG